jgi:O-succinylbenzoic acid--CoA ligase
VTQRTAVVVQTSGSTGRPKRVALSASALLASAAASDTMLGGPGQWLLCLPAHYIAGINVLVRSFAAQTEPVIMQGAFTASGFAEAAAELDHPVRYTSLVPAQLSRLLREDAGVEALRRFDRVLVGGQALPQRMHALAIESGINITRTYGSSETSGGCVYDGVPIGDTIARIHNGRVELSGSVLAEGYLDDPERTAEAFVERDGRRWFRTDDAGEVVDGVLHVTGRVDDVIVSGGVKVFLAEVEAVVRSLEGLVDAVVVAAPHAEWGESSVVVHTVGMPLPQLREVVVVRLGPAAAPSRIVLVDELPLLASGKPDRVAIAALVLGAP